MDAQISCHPRWVGVAAGDCKRNYPYFRWDHRNYRQMKRLLLVVILVSCWASEGLSKGIEEDHIEFGPFGPLTVYSQSSQPSHVVLFISGDGGWNLGVIEMARELASLDAMVVGIDIVRYMKHLESQ